ncbi:MULTISPECIES: hypothetical protein [unclassified Pseudoalteromonas]|uniref:hypothetical protein n=1 Tax=unclassified Pseudoalteromonas TaxID=194690 RepID=UPI00110B3537|nr:MULTISPECIES: hypothetical protein [unclassified Pseudoalteromonas]TMP70246.1 hypothetical protein CWB76_11495 [Pseudoalteromonas sp. S1609]TMS62714.1 hypothetical protein CWC10_05240 [Pseudoalteromonas sp. S3173]
MLFSKVFAVTAAPTVINQNDLGAQTCDNYSIIVAGPAASVKYKIKGATNQIDLGELTGQNKLEVGDITEFELISASATEVIIQGF